MDQQAIYDRVTQTMADLFDLDRARLTPDVKFEDLGLTSIDAIDLIVELQSITGRKVAEAGLREVRTIGDIVKLVETHLATPEAG
jgi:acyl carrier protein